MSSISLKDGEKPESPRRQMLRGRQMNARPLKTAYELSDMIVEQAMDLHGPWPPGMTLFIFDDAYGWTASISRPSSEADNIYRTCTLDLIARLATEYDLDIPRLSDGLSDLAFSNPIFYLRHPHTQRRSTWQKASKEAIGKPRSPKKRRSK
jgi:hypothetical protein